jgi:hypothetical protein
MSLTALGAGLATLAQRVSFAAAWEKDDQKPGDKPVTNQATEIISGAPIDVPFQTVKRKISVFLAAVTLRYDKL